MKYLFSLSCFTYDSINTEHQKTQKRIQLTMRHFAETIFFMYVSFLHLESIECKLLIIGRFKKYENNIKIKSIAQNFLSIYNLLKDDHKELHELF